MSRNSIKWHFQIYGRLCWRIAAHPFDFAQGRLLRRTQGSSARSYGGAGEHRSNVGPRPALNEGSLLHAEQQESAVIELDVILFRSDERSLGHVGSG